MGISGFWPGSGQGVVGGRLGPIGGRVVGPLGSGGRRWGRLGARFFSVAGLSGRKRGGNFGGNLGGADSVDCPRDGGSLGRRISDQSHCIGRLLKCGHRFSCAGFLVSSDADFAPVDVDRNIGPRLDSTSRQPPKTLSRKRKPIQKRSEQIKDEANDSWKRGLG